MNYSSLVLKYCNCNKLNDILNSSISIDSRKNSKFDGYHDILYDTI